MFFACSELQKYDHQQYHHEVGDNCEYADAKRNRYEFRFIDDLAFDEL
jgi:hypothetical protein